MENHVVRQLIQYMNRWPAGELLKCAGHTPAGALRFGC